MEFIFVERKEDKRNLFFHLKIKFQEVAIAKILHIVENFEH